MATREHFELTQEERKRRVFSETFKKQKVREIELKKTTISEVSKAYQVRYSNVYNWVKKYSSNYKKGVKLIVEMESDTRKIILLKKQIAEMEKIIGQKQLLIDFQEKMIDLAEQEYGVDIKKKFDGNPLFTSGETDPQ